MLRNILLFVLAILVVRAVSRALGEVMAGYSSQSRQGQRGHAPERGVHMVRDPICGTFVVPERALPLSAGSRDVFFCSASCRDKYRARTA
jgi:YHS domain-containing protein